MSIDLQTLADNHFLKRVASGKSGYVDTNQLEKDFIAFSAYVPESQLLVVAPKLYQLQGEERARYAAALQAMGYEGETPSAIDISGAFNGQSNPNTIVIASLNQNVADHLLSERQFLNPLLENLFIDGKKLLMDFTIHSALYGTVSCLAPGADGEPLCLEEAHLFPEKFNKGQYTLRLQLETPERFVQGFMELEQALNAIKAEPKLSLLDKGKVDDVASKAIALRRSMGALSRYEVPETNVFDVETNSCIVNCNGSTMFYLYEPTKGRNIAVHFGGSPFTEEPRGLIVLNGEDYQETLVSLVKMGIFAPSPALLESRITDLTTMYANAARGMKKPLSEGYLDFKKLIEKLREIHTQLCAKANPEYRKEFALMQPTELLEFFVYPATDDPVVHELLPRMSWNASIREYHDSLGFMDRFEKATDKQRKDMLVLVKSNIMFSNQQNNNVNLWLYQNHKEFCEKSGIKFKLMEG